MILRDLLDLAGKEKREKERVRAVQKLTVGIVVMAAVGVVGFATGFFLALRSVKKIHADLRISDSIRIYEIKDIQIVDKEDKTVPTAELVINE